MKIKSTLDNKICNNYNKISSVVLKHIDYSMDRKTNFLRQKLFVTFWEIKNLHIIMKELSK